jgi:beta-lactamase superfamily II metal-dependent hydrolase
MYDIDFLAVENEDGNSNKSGDAIVIRISATGYNNPLIIVIDAGYTSTGDQVADHLLKLYGSVHIDLLISTHPDSDHLNGIRTVLERCDVDELLIHLPDRYRDASSLGNHDKLIEVLALAVEHGVTVSEPFTGLTRFADSIRVLGPSQDYYLQLLDDMLDAEQVAKSSFSSGAGALLQLAKRTLAKVLSYLPIETLGDDDDNSSRNQSSAIVLLTVDDHRVLFTGDAGIEALSRAADEYEARFGSFASTPLALFQIPHHGSKHNSGPSILTRVLGEHGAAYGETIAVASSSKTSEKHPSPKVTNAVLRRGVTPYATEGVSLWYHSGGAQRDEWSGTATPVPPLEEDD